MPPEENQELLASIPPASRGLEMAYPRNATIHELFEQQVALTPDAIAVQFGDQQLTYDELNRAANRLACHLRRFDIRPDGLVGIYLPRSLGLIVGLIAVLKSGGAYVALGSEHPREQLARMIDDAKLRLILTCENSTEGLPKGQAELFCLDAEGSGVNANPARNATSPNGSRSDDEANVHSGATALNLAYVSFTSGSTGESKGVCIPHRGVVRLVKNTNYAALGADQVFLQLAPVAFDASTFEIWAPLLNGGRLVVAPPDTLSRKSLGQVVASSGVTTLWLTAGLFHRVVDTGLEGMNGLRQWLVGGDVISVPHLQKAAAALPGCEFINGYGPTENTTFSCCHRIPRPVPQENSIPIGRPIANSCVYVLDAHGQLVPFGEAGELYVGGDGLARGYLNRPELTAQQFVPNPFIPGTQLYRTGDQVRYRADGNLEFLGRMDRQVKVRGYRVELTGIEAVIEKHPAIREAAVVAQGAVGHQFLSAYVVPNTGVRPTTDELTDFLRRKLPTYTLPKAFRWMPELPLTVSGKVDRAALPALQPGEKLETPASVTPAGTATEKLLATLWCETLGVSDVGIDDDFFQIGGDSLQAVTLLARIEEELGKTLPLVSAVHAHTIRELALVLDLDARTDRSRNAFVVPINFVETADPRPPLFLVHGQAGDELCSYLHLASHLPEDQPLLGLPSRDLVDGIEFETIEEIAADHVQAMCAVQPSGPYFLGGHCFGGLIAFEMAQQLQAQGERVALLAILDYPLNRDEAPHFDWSPGWCLKFLRNFGYAIADFWEAKDARQECIGRWFHRLRKHFPRHSSGHPDRLDFDNFGETACSRPAQLGRLRRQYEALRRYTPRSYAGPVTLFRPRRLPLLQPTDETLGWGKVATGHLGVQVVPVPGFHGYMVRWASAAKLAVQLEQVLSRAQKAEAHGNEARQAHAPSTLRS